MLVVILIVSVVLNRQKNNQKMNVHAITLFNCESCQIMFN
jgi:hypothetical protein